MEIRYSLAESLDRINELLIKSGFSDVEASWNTDRGTAYGVHIKNSHKVRSKALRMDVCGILARTEGVQRSAGNLSAEWVGHNAVYRVLKSRPEIGDADLEFSRDKRGVIRLLTGTLDLLGIH